MPVGDQENRTFGVTYKRSREPRMEEALEAGGDFFHEFMRRSDQNFFESIAAKVVEPGVAVHIRHDSHWNVPEPEPTLFLSSEGTLFRR